LTTPLSLFNDKAFRDTDELDGDGNGLPDLINDGTTFESQINLDGGNQATLYGIEETLGGTNTTLLAPGDQIRDSTVPFKTATIVDAGSLNEGVEHFSIMEITMDMRNPDNYNSIPFIAGETVTGVESLIEATVVSWDSANHILKVNNPVPYDTSDPGIGFLNEFSTNSTVVDVRMLQTGNGYLTEPDVEISPSIVNATATAELTADQVTIVTVNNGGYGYTSEPEIEFTSGSGSGAVGQGILGGEKLSGENGASWRILSIEYLTEVRNDTFA
jgi:hypothetical protein